MFLLLFFISPFSKGVKPAIALNNVDFPDPFFPLIIVSDPVSMTDLKSESIILDPLCMVKFSKLNIHNSNNFLLSIIFIQ